MEFPTQLEEPTDQSITTTWRGERYVRVATGPLPIAHWRMARWLNTLSDEDIDTLCFRVTAPNSGLSDRMRRRLMRDDMGALTPIEYIMWLSYNWSAAGLPDFADRTTNSL
jgi:hypothetical protein